MDIRVKTSKSSKRDREFVKEQGIAYILDMIRTHGELVQEAHNRNYGWVLALHSRLLKRNKGKAYVWVLETHEGFYKLKGSKKGATLTIGTRTHFGGPIKLERQKKIK